MSILGQPPRGLFVSDLDGTLLTEDKTVSGDDLQTFSRLQKMGILTAVATGRSDYSLKTLFNSLGFSENQASFPVDYIIFSTGAGIMTYPEEILLQSYSLGKDDIEYIVAYLHRLGLDFMLHRPIPDTRYFFYSSQDGYNPDFQTRLEIYADSARRLSVTDLNDIDGATEILCIVPHENGHQVAAKITRDLQQFSVIKATSPLDGKSIWIEIFLSNVCKSHAVRYLAELTGISRENVCAVGNDFNDEDLLLWAGHGFLVANGSAVLSSDLKRVASNNESGVSEAALSWLDSSGCLPIVI